MSILTHFSVAYRSLSVSLSDVCRIPALCLNCINSHAVCQVHLTHWHMVLD